MGFSLLLPISIDIQYYTDLKNCYPTVTKNKRNHCHNYVHVKKKVVMCVVFLENHCSIILHIIMLNCIHIFFTPDISYPIKTTEAYKAAYTEETIYSTISMNFFFFFFYIHFWKKRWKILKHIIYLHKGACNGSAPELVQQRFTHSYIRNTGHSICYYDDT